MKLIMSCDSVSTTTTSWKISKQKDSGGNWIIHIKTINGYSEHNYTINEKDLQNNKYPQLKNELRKTCSDPSLFESLDEYKK